MDKIKANVVYEEMALDVEVMMLPHIDEQGLIDYIETVATLDNGEVVSQRYFPEEYIEFEVCEDDDDDMDEQMFDIDSELNDVIKTLQLYLNDFATINSDASKTIN